MDIISEFENGDVIARIDGFDMPLHNAAPAMLAALERIVHTELIGGSAISMRMTASNAIARAKGGVS
jgi:hypothetical protein